MGGDEIGRMLYLALLLVAVGGWLFAQGRLAPGKMLQQAAVWGFLFLGVIAAYGLWNDIRRTTLALPQVSPEGRIVIPRAADGHFYLAARVNDVPLTFLVDTGASAIALSRSDARKVGIDPDALAYLSSANTANGVARTARVTLDSLTIGPITDRALRAFVMQGEMDGSLLGMSYLDRFSQVSIAADQMELRR